MFKPVKAKTVKEYFSSVPSQRREILLAIDKIIRKTAPSLKPNFIYNMPGYGKFPYQSSYKKETLEWPVISLASQKNYISIYVCAVDNGKYLAEMHAKELGNVNVGKSCIRFKKLEDLNLNTLRNIIKLAAKKPGFIGVGKTAKK
jgi:hypothetical protein